MPMKKSYLLVAVLLVATLVFSGCFLTDKLTEKATEKVTEKAAETLTNADVDISDESISIGTDEGELTFGTDEIPEDLPSDVPVYPDTTVVWTSSSSTDQSYWLDLETTDSFTEVETYYDDNLESNGWTIDDRSTYTSDGQKSTLYNTSQDNRTLVVTLASTEEETKTMISISTSTEEE